MLDNFGLNSRGETVLLDFGELSFVKSVAVKHSPYQYGKVGSETVIVILGGGHHPVRVSISNLSESSSALLPAYDTTGSRDSPNQPVCSGATRGKRQKRSSNTTGDEHRKPRCSIRSSTTPETTYSSSGSPDFSTTMGAYGMRC